MGQKGIDLNGSSGLKHTYFGGERLHLCISSLDYSSSFNSQGTFTSQVADEKTEAEVIARSKVTQLVSVRTRPLAPGFWLQVREPSNKCILNIIQANLYVLTFRGKIKLGPKRK